MKPTAEETRNQVQKILNSTTFSRADRLKRFLDYIVEESLADRADRIKGYSIAIEVFDRAPDFDPQNDPIVRVEASRLRKKLAIYYKDEGKSDSILIGLPKGAYRPEIKFSGDLISRNIDLKILTNNKRWFSIPEFNWGIPVFLIVLTLFVGYFSLVGTSQTQLSDSNINIKPVIAVVPFHTTGEPLLNNNFDTELSEEIAARLSQFSDLTIITRKKDQESGSVVEIQSIDQGININYILKGNIRNTDKNIRITTQLLDAINGSYVWTSTYEIDPDQDNLYEVQDIITAQIVGALGASHGIMTKVGLEKIRGIENAFLSAQDCTLRVHDYYRTLRSEKHLSVRTCLERATHEEPDHTRALTSLGLMYLDEHRYGFNQQPDSLERALKVVRHSIDLEPENQFAHSVLAKIYFHRKEMDRFLAEAEYALKLNPNKSEVLASLGQYLIYAGQQERGLSLVEKAMDLNPSYPDWYHFSLFFEHYRKGQFDRALKEIKQIEMPNYWGTYQALTLAYAQLGEKDKAQKALDDLLNLYPKFPEEIVALWRNRNIPETEIALIVDGLRKAGLKVDYKS